MNRQQVIADIKDEISDLTINTARKLGKKAERHFIASAIDVFKAAEIHHEESKYIDQLNEIMTKFFENEKKIPIIDSACWLKQITTVGSRYSEKYADIRIQLKDIKDRLIIETNNTRSIGALMKKEEEKLLKDIMPTGENNETMKWKEADIIEAERRKKQSVIEVAEEIDTGNTQNNKRKPSISANSDSSPRTNNNNNAFNGNNNNNNQKNKKNKNNRQADFEEGLKEKTEDLAKKSKEKTEAMRELVDVIKLAYAPSNNNNDLDAQIKAQQLAYWKLKTAKMAKDLNIEYKIDNLS